VNGNIYQGISLLSSMYKILSKILLSSLTPYIDKTIGDHWRGFWCNKATKEK